MKIIFLRRNSKKLQNLVLNNTLPFTANNSHTFCRQTFINTWREQFFLIETARGFEFLFFFFLCVGIKDRTIFFSFLDLTKTKQFILVIFFLSLNLYLEGYSFFKDNFRFTWWNSSLFFVKEDEDKASTIILIVSTHEYWTVIAFFPSLIICSFAMLK